MIFDLHSHTHYSFCAIDPPRVLIETAIENGIEMLGINDHNIGVNLHRAGTVYAAGNEYLYDYQRCLNTYFEHLSTLKELYKDRIRLVRGLEVATIGEPYRNLPDGIDLSQFDYCLFEHIDTPATCAPDIFGYAEKVRCKKAGIAHTDLFAMCRARGIAPEEFFKKMAKHDIFWEMNVNFDKPHGYYEHEYVKTFFTDREQQELIRACGVKLSVGFDSHFAEQYRADRVKDCCKRIEQLGLKTVAEDF